MKKKILIIEDDDDILKITTAILNHSNFEVAGISGTNDIIESVKVHGPDLILTDYMLPGLSGGQIATIIKVNAATSHIPVILMSAYDKKAIAIGNFNYDAYVKKPFHIDHLVKVIKRYIN